MSGGIWYSIAATTVGAVDLVLVALLSRLLSPADFGIMAMAMLVVNFAASYLDMGLCPAVIQRKKVTCQQFSIVYWFTILSGFLLWAAISLVAPLIALFFKEPLLRLLLPVTAFSFVIMAAGIPFDWMLERELKFETLAKMDISKALAGLIVATVGALCGLGIWALVWGYLARSVLGTVWLLVVGLPNWKPHFLFHLSELRSYMRFGLLQMGDRTVVSLNYQMDQVLVGALLGAQQLGYYSFAVNQLLQPICRLSPTLLRIALPIFSKVQDDHSTLQEHYHKMMRLLNALNAPLLFGLAALAPVLVPAIFGAQWIPALPCLQVLSLYMFCRNASEALGPLLLAKGRAGLSLRWNLGILLALAPAIVAGAMWGGILGVSMALALLMALVLAASYFRLVRPLIGECGSLFASCILKPALMSLVLALALRLSSAYLEPSLPVLLTESLTGILLYLALERYFDRDNFAEVAGLVAGALRVGRAVQK